MNHTALMEALQSQQGQQRLGHLYGHRDDAVQRQTARYTALISRHAALFGPQENVLIVSAPGRTEIVGNHTDHNRGRVLAAAINLDTLAVVSLREDMVVNLHSEGYPAITMDLSDLAPHPEERETTAALIRGVADGLHRRGYRADRVQVEAPLKENLAAALLSLLFAGLGFRKRPVPKKLFE